MIKKLRFPRASVLPYQTEPMGCFAATSIGILEFYAGRVSSTTQGDITRLHWALRRGVDSGMGSVKVLLKHYDCFGSGWHRDNLQDPTAFFDLIKQQIDRNRPVVLQLSKKPCWPI